MVKTQTKVWRMIMCKTCGCDEGQKTFWSQQNIENKHSHDHDNDHDFDHNHHHHHHHHQQENSHTHDHAQMYKKVNSNKIQMHDNILSNNDNIATQNRQYFVNNNITTINIMSSPGSGKTSLLTKTLSELNKSNLPVASLVGDQTTDLDGQRLKESATWVHQINTYSSCHLDAKHIQNAIPLLPGDLNPKFLFIENVGNLVCPAAFDLGEQIKVALLSCPEGEDKVLKYPVMFHLAHIVILTKIDLIPHLKWDHSLFKHNLKKINPVARYFELSSQTGQGMIEWTQFLKTI